MCILEDTAVRLGQTTRQVCELASPAIGASTYWEWKSSGVVPGWLSAWCQDILTGGRPARALNLLAERAGQPQSGTGVFGQPVDLEDDACQEGT